jgi:hypothetical protein
MDDRWPIQGGPIPHLEHLLPSMVVSRRLPQVICAGYLGSNETLLNFYYRLLGAKIGKKAHISLQCDLAEFDLLVSIGEDAAIAFATVRAFGVDNGAMILGRVSVGSSASVGDRSVVAPYTSVPDGCHLGPKTSSYEIGKALDTKHARYNRCCMPEPRWSMLLLIEGPITFLVNAFGQDCMFCLPCSNIKAMPTKSFRYPATRWNGYAIPCAFPSSLAFAWLKPCSLHSFTWWRPFWPRSY